MIPWIRLCSMWGMPDHVLYRLTIGLLFHSQMIGIIISSECPAQMSSEQAGDCSSSPRNDASSTLEGKGDPMTQAHPEGPYMQMHRKSGGHEIHPENSEKWIEDAGLHNPLPHLYNLQGKSRLKSAAYRKQTSKKTKR